jgi:hypothetical protein
MSPIAEYPRSVSESVAIPCAELSFSEDSASFRLPRFPSARIFTGINVFCYSKGEYQIAQKRVHENLNHQSPTSPFILSALIWAKKTILIGGSFPADMASTSVFFVPVQDDLAGYREL